MTYKETICSLREDVPHVSSVHKRETISEFLECVCVCVCVCVCLCLSQCTRVRMPRFLRRFLSSYYDVSCVRASGCACLFLALFFRFSLCLYSLCGCVLVSLSLSFSLSISFSHSLRVVLCVYVYMCKYYLKYTVSHVSSADKR